MSDKKSKDKGIRLDRFLAEASVGTRSEVKKYIQKGMVSVNGEIMKKPEYKVCASDEVMFDGSMIGAAPEFVYYVLHKPAGVLSATEDRHQKTVLDLLPPDRRNLFPVGRLDKDTEGLLLITDDGMLAHELLSPAKHVAKTYYVVAEGMLGDAKVRKLEDGLDIGEKKETMPAKAELLGEDREKYFTGKWFREPENMNFPEKRTELLLTIQEGKFHQVKRMLEAVGSRVCYLRRISMGGLALPEDLAPGEYRMLSSEEVHKIRKN